MIVLRKRRVNYIEFPTEDTHLTGFIYEDYCCTEIMRLLEGYTIHKNYQPPYKVTSSYVSSFVRYHDYRINGICYFISTVYKFVVAAKMYIVIVTAV